MFDGIADFIKNFFLKMMVKLPESPFDLDQAYAQLNETMGHVNYFVPFYIFKDLFNAWAVTVFGGMGIYMLFKWVKKLMGL